MKNIKLFFLSLITVISAAAQDGNKEQLVVPLNDPGKPYKLNVNLVNGSIKIVGYDGKDIMIDGETEGGRKREERSESGMRKLNSHTLSIAAQVKNNQGKASAAGAAALLLVSLHFALLIVAVYALRLLIKSYPVYRVAICVCGW